MHVGCNVLVEVIHAAGELGLVIDDGEDGFIVGVEHLDRRLGDGDGAKHERQNER